LAPSGLVSEFEAYQHAEKERKCNSNDYRPVENHTFSLSPNYLTEARRIGCLLNNDSRRLHGQAASSDQNMEESVRLGADAVSIHINLGAEKDIEMLALFGSPPRSDPNGEFRCQR